MQKNFEATPLIHEVHGNHFIFRTVGYINVM